MWLNGNNHMNLVAYKGFEFSKKKNKNNENKKILIKKNQLLEKK